MKTFIVVLLIFLQVVPNHAQTAPLPLPADGIWQMHWFLYGRTIARYFYISAIRGIQHQ